MAIAFFCTKCGNGLSALYVGEELTCPQCGEVNTAPAPPTTAPPSPVPEVAAPAAAPPPVQPTVVMAPPPPPAAPAYGATAPNAGYGTSSLGAPAAARPPRKGLGLTCCCGCGALGALLALAATIALVVAVIPRVQAQQYLQQATAAETPVIEALGKYTTDPSWKAVREHEFSPDNMGKARDALTALAKSSADARHAVEAAEKQLAGVKVPGKLADVHRELGDLNKLVAEGLNEMEPQIDYLAFVVQSLATAAKSFREMEGSSVTSLDQAAALLSKCRAAVKAIHDEIMVKSAPPGCEKLHTDTIKSLEAMSSACQQMTDAIRARNYRRMLALSKTFESSMTSAAKRFETAYDAWGSQADQRSIKFAEQVKAKLEALSKRLDEAREKYGVPASPDGGGNAAKESAKT